MNELLSSKLWPRIRQLARRASRKVAAVAYVTDDTHIKFGEGDILITDASDEAIKAGQTSAAVLEAAWKRGTRITSIAGLHSKLYVFDRCAIIGSANLSKESEKRTEVALLTDQPTIVSSARLLIEQLKSEGQEVNASFVDRINELPVTKRKKRPSSQRPARTNDQLARSWLVGLKSVEEPPSEKILAEQGLEEAEKHVTDEDSSVSWIRFRGNSRFRREAKPGDVVICIWTESGNGRPNRVYHHAPIILRKDDRKNDVTFIYVEDYPDAEKTAISWAQFRRLYAQVGMSEKPSQWATREIASHQSDALHSLWFS